MLARSAHASGDVDVLIEDAGPGFEQAGDEVGQGGAVSRTFMHPAGQLILQYTPIGQDMDAAVFFSFVDQAAFQFPGLVPVDVPGLPLARWSATEGIPPEQAPVVVVLFASRTGIFTALLSTDDVQALPPVTTLLEVARRQIERSGGAPDAGDAGSGSGGRAAPPDPDLEATLPDDPAQDFGLHQPLTVSGVDEIPDAVGIDPEVVSFLNNRSRTAARAWANPQTGLTAAVSVTEYPYDVFAAAALAAIIDDPDTEARVFRGTEDVADVHTFLGTGDKDGQVGAALRRGRFSAIVLAQAGEGGLQEAAGAVVDLTRQLEGRLPAEASGPYRFPSPPSTFAGLAVTSVAVTAAGLASVGVGRARAWTLRRSDEPPLVVVASPPAAGVVPLDADATDLRRRGIVVVAAQLIALNVIVISLAGDFGWPGVAVAVLGLAGGLGFTSWWRRKELGALGPKGSGTPFIFPRPAGAVVGIISLAVLGVGVSYSLKGIRYLLLKPSLAQLRWSNLLGLSPRGVGVAFAIGGLIVAVIGGILFRVARALGRADTRRLLAVDHRPPVLYLRSFGDDKVPLATIASARRPFFELFSFRGRDPFEEAVAWEFATYGPVVAVGRPGQSLASLGAAREHLSDDTWQEQVALRMHDARAVVVATGETPGLRWEVSQVVAGGHLGKAVFVFPPLDGDALARRWEFTSAALAAAGAPVDALPADPALIHTAQVAADGVVTVTIATRRDEASYRTAVDRTMERLLA
jgi:hypothetical protein